MYFVIIVLLGTLAASVSARPIVVSHDLSYAGAPAFRNDMRFNDVDTKAGGEDKPYIQPRNDALVDVLDLDNQDAGSSDQYYDKEATHYPPNNDLSIVPRASKTPKTTTKSKSELRADDKKFHRDQLKPKDGKYINNLDRLNSKNCGKHCGDSINSYRSQQSKELKEKERNKPHLPGSRASRGEVNTKQDDYNHDFNHLRQDRGDIGKHGLQSLDSWHSVESANSKASKASRASKAKGGRNHG